MRQFLFIIVLAVALCTTSCKSSKSDADSQRIKDLEEQLKVCQEETVIPDTVYNVIYTGDINLDSEIEKREMIITDLMNRVDSLEIRCAELEYLKNNHNN